MTIHDLPKQREIITPEGGWKERAYYVVEVAHDKNNPIFRSIFYTGFLDSPDGKPGSYNSVLHHCHAGQIIRMIDLYYMKAICEIPEMKD